MGKPKLYKFTNGAVILYERKKICSASAVSAGFYVGQKDCIDFMPGLTHFMEHALFLGSKKYTRDQIKAKIAKLSFNAFTTNNMMHADFYVSNRNLNEALDVTSDMLLNPLFNEGELKNELKVVFEERERKKSMLSRDFYYQHSLNIYGDSCYTPENAIGTEDCLGRVTPEDLFNFKNKYFTLNNFFFAITTSLPFYKVKSLVNKYFIKNLQNKYCPPDHDRHFHYTRSEPKMVLVNDNSLSSFKVLISNIFKTKVEEFLNDPTINFINWYNRKNINNFIKNARNEGLIYTGNHVISRNNTYDYSFDDFQFETSKSENIEEIMKLIHQDIKFIKSKPITEADIKEFVTEEYIDHDKEFPLNYSHSKNILSENYAFLDKIIYRPFKVRIKEMKKMTLEHINEVIDRIYSKDNDVYITIMGKTDNKEFKTYKEYKKIIFG